MLRSLICLSFSLFFCRYCFAAETLKRVWRRKTRRAGKKKFVRSWHHADDVVIVESLKSKIEVVGSVG